MFTEKSKSNFNLQSQITFLTENFGYCEAKDKNTNRSSTKKLSINDFRILKVIGTGTFGKVLLVIKNDTNEVLAMKILKIG